MQVKKEVAQSHILVPERKKEELRQSAEREDNKAGTTELGRRRVDRKGQVQSRREKVGGGKNNFKILILAGRYLNVRSEEKAVRNIK